jgi:hypothetical protein
VAAFYPDTANKLGDDILRYNDSGAYFPRAKALRQALDYDWVSEAMILDGALSHYKVLTFLVGRVTEKPVLEAIDRWLRGGGAIIYPMRQQARQGFLATVEGDRSITQRWLDGDTGEGRLISYEGTPDPFTEYVRFVKQQVHEMKTIHPSVRRVLEADVPPGVFWSVLQNGDLVLLNFTEKQADVRMQSRKDIRLAPLSITIE